MQSRTRGLALRYADHGYVLENGRVVASGTAAELAARPDVAHFYLGVGRTAVPRSLSTKDVPS